MRGAESPISIIGFSQDLRCGTGKNSLTLLLWYELKTKTMEREIFYSEHKDKVIIISPIGEMNGVLDHLDRQEFKYKNLLIIGNGFDLNLGLKSTYRDFAESCLFKRMYVKRQKEKRSKNNPTPSLIDYLYGKKFFERWYDIEAALLEYVSRKPDRSFVNNVNEDKEDYRLVCTTLVEYLASLLNPHNHAKLSQIMDSSAAAKVLLKFRGKQNIVYSFNYTPITMIADLVFANLKSEVVKVHGEIEEDSIFKDRLKDNSIILGIETNNLNDIAPGYSFLLKSNNPSYKSTNMAYDLLCTKNVIFFGHSLNQMDFGYFESYFKLLSTNADTRRKLTLITKDENSRVTILDNLRKSGISVRDLFAHTQVDIILTDDIDKEESESNSNFNDLLEKLQDF